MMGNGFAFPTTSIGFATAFLLRARAEGSVDKG